MSSEKLHTVASAAAGLIARPTATEALDAHGRYEIECRDADGNLKWSDEIDNLVVTVGRNAMLDAFLAGSAWTTGTVYMGLVNGATTPTYASTDTMASHTGWTELNITASAGLRQSVAFSAAASGAKATTSAVVWSITSSGTIAGCFIVVGGTSTNANTTGTLFSVGSFTGGNRTVANGDTLNVTYSASV